MNFNPSWIDPRICRRRNFAKAAGAERAPGRIPVRFVQHVEELASKLKPHPARDRDVLEQGQIEHARARTDHCRASSVAEAIGRCDETLRCEEPLERLLTTRQIRIAHTVWSDSAVRADAEWVARSKDRDREARLPLVNPIHLPVADDLMDNAGNVVAEPLAVAERQIVKEGGYKSVLCDGSAPAPSRPPDRRCSGCGCRCRYCRR